MLIEAGGGSSSHPSRHMRRSPAAHQLKQWFPHGTPTSAPAPAPRPASNNGNARTQFGVKLDYERPHDTAQQYYQPPHAQQGGTDEHSGEGPDSMWSQVLQQAFRPADARADREKAERKVQASMDQNRAERSDVLARGPKKPKVERMTWHEYNLLTPRERAAIDFNTMLVKAVRKDISSQDEYQPGPTESKQYEATLKQAFGSKDRGSDKYFAPETMAVLKQIKFHDVNSDLDDFLQLRVAITDADLRGLKFPANENKVTNVVANLANQANYTPEEQVQSVQGQLALNTKRMEQKLADGNNMLRAMPAIAAQERNFILKRLGGTANKSKPGLGYQTPDFVDGPNGPEPADLNTYFIQAFDQLAGNAAPSATKGKILGAAKEVVESHGVSFDEFLGYLNDRSNTAKQFDQALGEVRGVKYRSPEDFRKMLGFGEGVRE